MWVMIEIIFEPHGTTIDNEAHRSSGHFDVELSELGKKQAQEMGKRYENDHFDTIFCSDLQRAYKSAEIAFDKKFPIIKDARLRECDYGDFTRNPSEQVEADKANRIKIPFPNGESYEQTAERMRNFLEDLLKKYDGKKIMIIGHRATQYGLERWTRGVPLGVVAPYPWKWQTGWKYKFEKIIEKPKHNAKPYV